MLILVGSGWSSLKTAAVAVKYVDFIDKAKDTLVDTLPINLAKDARLSDGTVVETLGHYRQALTSVAWKYRELWTTSLELLQFFNNPKRRSTPYFLW